MMECTQSSETTREAILQCHMASYDKLLKYAVSRFSCAKLHDRLTLLFRTIANPHSSNSNISKEGTSTSSIKSLGELRQALMRIADMADSEHEEELSMELMSYFDSFFEDVQFLREVKKYFDQRIHWYLYEHYYDPVDDDLDLKLDYAALKASSESGLHMGNIAGMSNLLAHDMSNKQRLGCIVRELFTLSMKWDNLLRDGEIDKDSFDVESANKISTFPNVSSFESLLRLIPDLFVKSFRAFGLAQCWSTVALAEYDNSLSLNRPISARDITKRQEVMKERNLSLTLEIAEAEEKLEEENKQLRILRGRELRNLILAKECNMVEDLKEVAEKTITKLSKRKDKLPNKRSTSLTKTKTKCEESKATHQQHQQRKEVESKLFAANCELRVVTFKLKLLREDQQLQLLFTHDIVCYVRQSEERVCSLEQMLCGKRLERAATEKAIWCIRNNCARMRQIAEKHYRRRHCATGVSVETNEGGETLSTSTSEAGNAESDEELIQNDYNPQTATTSATATTPPPSSPPTNTTTLAFTAHRDATTATVAMTVDVPRETVSQSSGILKRSAKRVTSTSARTGSLPSSPFAGMGARVDGMRMGRRGRRRSWDRNKSMMSDIARIKTVRWKVPPVSDESDFEQDSLT